MHLYGLKNFRPLESGIAGPGHGSAAMGYFLSFFMNDAMTSQLTAMKATNQAIISILLAVVLPYKDCQ
jgi:hypothetical protein